MGKRIIVSESEREGILEMHHEAIRKNLLNENVPMENPAEKRDTDLAGQREKIEQLKSDVGEIKDNLTGQRFDNAILKLKSFINNTIESIDKKIDEFRIQRNEKEIKNLENAKQKLILKLDELQKSGNSLTDKEKEDLNLLLPTIGTYLIGIPFFKAIADDLSDRRENTNN